MDRATMFNIVKSSIDDWNPYLLLLHAPSDEFDCESSSVSGRIKENSSVDEVAAIVSEVFSEAFEPEGFQKENCLGVAEKIKAKIEAHCLK